MSKSIQLKNSNNEIIYPYALLKEFVLYDDPKGSVNNITLSDNVSNYKYIDIFYKNNDNLYSSVKVYSPNDKKVCLTCNNPTSDFIYWKNKVVSVKDNTINNYSYNQDWASNNSNVGHQNANFIGIVRVVGYK